MVLAAFLPLPGEVVDQLLVVLQPLLNRLQVSLQAIRINLDGSRPCQFLTAYHRGVGFNVTINSLRHCITITTIIICSIIR